MAHMVDVSRRSFVTREIDARTATRLITGAVTPRPIGWVGTTSAEGHDNLAPFSFFNVVSTEPPMVMFSTGVRGGREKDTLANIRSHPRFTVSLATDALAHSVNHSSAEVSSEVDEFHLAQVTKFHPPGSPPAVAESPVVMACELEQIVDLTTDGHGYVMVIGRVLSFHLHETASDEVGHINQQSIGAIARMGGPTYARTTDLFDMERPSCACPTDPLTS